MSDNRILKKYQVNLGMPLEINSPFRMYEIQKKKDEKEDPKDNQAEEPEKEIENAAKQSELIINEAKSKAKKILDDAEGEALKIITKLREDAHKEGYEEGSREAAEKHEELIKEAEFIREHAKSEYQDVMKSLEGDVVDLVIESMKKILNLELNTSRDRIMGVVREAIEQCSGREHLLLKVSACDYDTVIENREAILSMAEGIGELEIKGDKLLKKGSCIVETPYGCVDSSMDKKIKKLESAFLQLTGGS